MSDNNTDLILSHKKLSEFFYSHLSQINKSTICPVPEEFLFYSSEVLDKYAISEAFFSFEEGKVQEKIMGTRILEAHKLPSTERIETYKDVGDTVLVLLGMFKERVEKKIVTQDYYLKLAQTAYANIGDLDCSFYDIPDFYKLFATSLERTIFVIETMFRSNAYKDLEKFLLHEGKDSDFEIIKNFSKKSS